MRKLIMAIVILILASTANAAEHLDLSDLVKKIPAMKQGLAWSIQDKNVNYITTISLIEKWGFSLEAGYGAKDELIGVISYNVINLRDYVKTPILDLIEFNVGMGYAFDGITTKGAGEDIMVTATFLDVKF